MASGYHKFVDEDFGYTDLDEGQDTEESSVFFAVSTHNRFEQKENGGDFKQITKKRKKGSSAGSSDCFNGLRTDDKLERIYDQVTKNYDKIRGIEKQQLSLHKELHNVNKGFQDLDERLSKMEDLCKEQDWKVKVLSYKSVDCESRSMRNNLVIYGLTEKSHFQNCKSLVLGFLEDEIDIDTTDMYIERAHRFGRLTQDKYKGMTDPKRPMVVRFRDFVDTENIINKAYKLKGSNLGIDRQYLREIAMARASLYKTAEARTARSNRQKVQIKYPAVLFIDGKCVKDMFPEWWKVLGTDIKNPADRLNDNNYWSGLSDRRMNRTYSCTTEEDNISGQDEELNSVQSESESTRACSDVNNVSRDQQQAMGMNKTSINSDINLPREDVVHSKTQVSEKNIKYNLNNDKRTNTQQKQNKNIQRTGIPHNGMTSQS
jgi:hypothetical protein